jgi:hypothetical protein
MPSLRTDLSRYETALIEANLNMRTVRSEMKCAEQFLRWLDGDFIPAEQGE